MDYEELILIRQESDTDDCSGCEYLEECRAGRKHGCIWNEEV